EVYIGGAGLTRGYTGHAALTAEKLLPHPFSQQPGARLYKTGDIARYRQDGSIEYLERRDRQIKIRGFRVEAGEVEHALLEYTQVREVAVTAREDAPGDLRLVAYLVLQDGVDLTDNDLHQSLKKHLPEYMLPATFVRLDALPLSQNGKVDYQALAALDAQHPVLETVYITPQTDLEQQIAAIVREVLHVTQVGIHDN